jgi:hypothetical protein
MSDWRKRMRTSPPMKVAIVKKSRGRLEGGGIDASESANATYKRFSPMKREAYRAVDVKQALIESLVADTPSCKSPDKSSDKNYANIAREIGYNGDSAIRARHLFILGD